MHPILFHIPVDVVARFLAFPLILVLTGLVAFLTYRRARAHGDTKDQAVNAMVFPTVAAFGLMVLVREFNKPWPLHTYGFLIMVGFIFAIFVAVREARRTGFDPEVVLDMGFWALVGGMVGARIYFIAVNWRDYFVTNAWTHVKLRNLEFDIPSVLAVWQGGLVFYGGLIGAAAVFFWFSYKRGVNIGQFADIFIVGLPLGHAFGRLGCFAAGCCWGDAAYHVTATGQVVADFPFAAQFPRDSLAYGSLLKTVDAPLHDLMVHSGHTLPLYPTQLMEATGELLIFGILLLVRGRKAFHGQVAATFFLLYPLLRATLEFFRGDTERGYVIDRVLSVGQFTSILIALAALGVIIFLTSRARAGATAPGAAPAQAQGT